jgi:hypothetical protein
METKKIADRTVKDIFVDMIGNKNAEFVLFEIQKKFDSGLTGEELKRFAKSELEKYPEYIRLSPELRTMPTQVVFYGH